MSLHTVMIWTTIRLIRRKGSQGFLIDLLTKVTYQSDMAGKGVWSVFLLNKYIYLHIIKTGRQQVFYLWIAWTGIGLCLIKTFIKSERW